MQKDDDNLPAKMIQVGKELRPASHVPGVPICGAKKSKGGLCGKLAIKNVNGEFTRCANHGGKSTGPKSGDLQRSKRPSERLIAKLERAASDNQLVDTQKQVAMAATLIQEYLEGLPKQNLLDQEDIAKLLAMTETLSKIAKRDHEIRVGNTLTIRIEQVTYLMHYVATKAVEHFGNVAPEALDGFCSDLEDYRVIDNERR